MSEMDVIVSATINAADLIDMSDSLGTIEDGKYADIIAVDRSPLDDIEELLDVDFRHEGWQGLQAVASTMAAMTPSTLRIGRRYRPARLAPPLRRHRHRIRHGRAHDGGAAQRTGPKVCVLEQHYTAGGYTHSFERNGYEWDVGVHYIGDVGAKTQTRRMFDFLSDGKLEWAPMDSEYDRFFVGDKVFNAKAGKQAVPRQPDAAVS